MKHNDFDIIVIGGGHAGVEAALAAARMGKTAAIVTMDGSKLALMSCNPAVGGTGKSQLVKEIDALGGLIGSICRADRQFGRPALRQIESSTVNSLSITLQTREK